MSRPFHFNENATRSPLDRQPPNPFPAGQPPSFKTNVNRMKTKKWVDAKPYSYDGDDWGEYDEYDEYGADANADADPTPPQHAPAHRPGFGAAENRRSFTDPPAAARLTTGRRNSFEAGEEQRAFSSSMTMPVGNGNKAPGRPRHASAADSEVSDTPQHRRDFVPSALPPPLHARASPEAPSTQRYPPRKSSFGQSDAPVAGIPTSPTSADKPLPFIRPADIYRRVDEERQRERESLDSGRPSLDALSRQGDNGSTGLESGSSRPAAQEKSNYGAASDASWQQPVLPPVHLSSMDSSSFRSVVDQAFERSDDHSVPPTPTDKRSDSGVSRSNTDSTSGISPIMSRVPSSATAMIKNRGIEGRQSTPAIAEEPNEGSVTPPAPRPHQIPRKPSPMHSRNASSSSIARVPTPQRHLGTPSSGESPGRSPAFEARKHLAEPEAAVIGTLSPDSPATVKADFPPSVAYAAREADIASVAQHGGASASEVGNAAKESQAAFLVSHPRSRSPSPSKGRVQELAGKFGVVSSSRRGSTQSTASGGSVQSWEKDDEPARAQSSSPNKLGGSRSPSPSKNSRKHDAASFRPRLPGQWESYATTVATPLEPAAEDVRSAPQPLDDVDFTPTTAKRPVSGSKLSQSADPLWALRAAGAAMGEAIEASAGVGSSLQHDGERDVDQPAEEHGRSVGDVYMRPLQLDRTASSVASIEAPTPPLKATPLSEDVPPPPPLKEAGSRSVSASQQLTPARPSLAPQLSTTTAPNDQESDRLRKEIVASLNAHDDSPTDDRDMLQPGATTAPLRDSAVLPSEYDNYWADSGPADASQRDSGLHASLDEVLPRPVLDTRFSWEQQQQRDAHAGRAPAADSPTTVRKVTEDAPEAASPQIPIAGERGSYGGLHVVNTARDPEAVELPPRLSAEAAAQAPQVDDAAMTAPVRASASPPSPGSQGAAATSPSDKPLKFGEIAALKSAADRIATYNKTREFWAKMDHGLAEWMTLAMTANPDFGAPAAASPPALGKVPALGGSMRHRPTGSLSFFKPSPGSSAAPDAPSAAPSTAQYSTSPTSSSAHGFGAGAGAGGGAPKMSRDQMQAKGKDLLHSAGVFSGKATTSAVTGAKGLFAKGKSRFRNSGGEKVDK